MQLAALSASHDCNASASIPAAPMHALYERLNVQGCAFRHIFLKGAKGLANLCMNSIRTKRWLPGHVMGLFLVQDRGTRHRIGSLISLAFAKEWPTKLIIPSRALSRPSELETTPRIKQTPFPSLRPQGACCAQARQLKSSGWSRGITRVVMRCMGTAEQRWDRCRCR